MELLMGVPQHHREIFEHVDSYLSKRFPYGIESLMVSLPSNIEEIKDKFPIFKLEDNFPYKLAKMYEKKGTRIIPGCGPIRSNPFDSILSSVLWYLSDTYVTHLTGERHLNTINNQDPQVVVVGVQQANYIKRNLPKVEYVVMHIAPRTFPEMIGQVVVNPFKPTQIITLKQ